MRYRLTVDRGAIQSGGPCVRIEEAGVEHLASEVIIHGESRLGRIEGQRVAIETDGPITEIP